MAASRDNSQLYPKEFPLGIGDPPVACAIYHGPDDKGFGIQEENGPEGRRAVVYFQCYWEDRLDLVAALVGTVDYAGGTILRKDPFVYPTADRDQQSGKMFPNRLFCTGIRSIEGSKMFRDDDGTNTGLAGWSGYTYAILAAEFGSPPYLVEDLLGPGVLPTDPSFNDLTYQQYVISRTNVAGEVFSPPTGAFVFSSGSFSGQPLLDVGASQIRTRFEISCTRVRMPLVPMTTITSLVGTVNSGQFLVGGQLFPEEAVLFLGANPEQRTDPYNGGIVWDVELKFMANGPGPGNDTPLSWNKFLDPGGNWESVTTKGGQPVFKSADHLELFDNAIS